MVLDMVAQNQCRSTRGIARELGVEHCAVHLILQDEDLYPYHYSQVQGLMPHDYHHHLQYCEWLLREHEHVPGFLKHILWLDEATFTCEGVFNSHNSHLWAQHNPHVTHESGHQIRWSIMCGPVSLAIVWLGHTYYPTTLVALLIVCSCRKCYWCCLKMCHRQFNVTRGFNTMGRQRILVHRPNSISAHSFLTGG
jgi:hypothetical protein